VSFNADKLRVTHGENVSLRQYDSAETFNISKRKAEKEVEEHVKDLAELHDLLYAENKRALLIVLQGMDAAGKDGTIRHVMSGVNPQGCTVTSFKEPSTKELEHDFLWRIHAAVPEKGSIGIFNRSHYEDVLVVRVHRIVAKQIWQARYEQINAFERILVENDVCLLKFFLHISREEQEKRFQQRLDDPQKNWKISPADFREREYWDEYQKAYEDAITKCSTKEAPWYIIPSDHKWFRNYCVSHIVLRTLQSFHMRYPKANPDVAGVKTGGKTATR
jgi:PPK2 family polyphosphate:nucleotide phosphotransferase